MAKGNKNLLALQEIQGKSDYRIKNGKYLLEIVTYEDYQEVTQLLDEIIFLHHYLLNYYYG